jgi:hypothetical protein
MRKLVDRRGLFEQREIGNFIWLLEWFFSLTCLALAL